MNMKIEYEPPVFHLRPLVQQGMMCASFHDNDRTEIWNADDEETI